jgi:hypothetical protein
MLAKSGDSAASLSLALGSRLAIKTLIASRNKVQLDAQVQSTVHDVVTSLGAISARGPLFERLTVPSNFERYEQFELLVEVKSAFGDCDLAARLNSILATDANITDRQKDIDLAIEFFTALESRAWQRYNNAVNPSF